MFCVSFAKSANSHKQPDLIRNPQHNKSFFKSIQVTFDISYKQAKKLLPESLQETDGSERHHPKAAAVLQSSSCLSARSNLCHKRVESEFVGRNGMRIHKWPLTYTFRYFSKIAARWTSFGSWFGAGESWEGVRITWDPAISNQQIINVSHIWKQSLSTLKLSGLELGWFGNGLDSLSKP